MPNRTKEEILDGLLIPRGSVIIPSIYTINRDPEIYTNPNDFDPSRWIDSAGHRVVFDYTDGRSGVFGYGRRICPGIDLANGSLIAAFATWCWAFDTTPKLDTQGKPLIPTEAVIDEGILVRPVPFAFDLKIRRDVNLADFTKA